MDEHKDQIGMSFTDSELHLVDQDLKKQVKEKKIVAWKNETLYAALRVTNKSDKVVEHEIVFNQANEDGISPEAFSLFWLKPVKAYTGMPGFADRSRPLPEGDRKEAEEVLFPARKVKVQPDETQAYLLKVVIPITAQQGMSRTTITLQDDQGYPLDDLTFKIDVLDLTLPSIEESKESFPLIIWQNPYALAEYYDVKPFSEEHIKLLGAHMDLYKEAGGETITASIVEDAWNGQTYSKNPIKYPSMVKWTRKTDGTFEYDYTDLDKWLAFTKQKGLGRKTIFYSIAPWHSKIIYYDSEREEMSELPINSDNESYTVIEDFLIDLYDHLKSKKWHQNVFIGVDERGFDKDLIDIVLKNNANGNTRYKLSGAVDNFEESKDIIEHFEDISISFNAIEDDKRPFENLLKDRKEKKLKTFMYSCTRHIPGNFTLSAPGESYWTILKTHALNSDGFLRWAYDSWVEDPLEDTTHNAFEAGDCFLVYPDFKSASEPASRSSIRFEKIREGIQDVKKMKYLTERSPKLSDDITEALTIFNKQYEADEFYLTRAGKQALASDVKAFKEKVAEWSNQTV